MQKASVAEWRQGWPVVFAAVLGTTTAALHISSLGPLMRLIQADTGWSRQQVVTGMTIVSLVSFCMLPLGGALTDRFGARRVAAPGVVLYALGFVALSQANSAIGSWIFGWVVLALAISAIQTVWITGVSGHFETSRGMAIAVAASGSGIASIATPFIVTLLAEHYGWRGAYLRVALFPLVITLPAVLTLFTDARFTRSSGAAAKAAPKSIPPKAPLAGGSSVREILLSRPFWQMAAGGLLITSAGTGIAIHLVPIIMDKGVSAKGAAAIAAFLGIGVIVGRLVGGYLIDRIHAGRVGAAFAILAAVGLVAIMTGLNGFALLSIIVFLFGLALGTEADCVAYLVSKYFGFKNFGFAFAALAGLYVIGAGVTPLVGGMLYDSLKNYQAFEGVLAAAFAAGAICFALLGPYPQARPPSDQAA